MTLSFFHRLIDRREILSTRISPVERTIACRGVRFENIAAVIFDKDGTLENSLSFWREIGIQSARLIDAQIPGVGEPLTMAYGIQDNTLDPTGLLAVGSRQENEIATAAYIAETGRSWQEAKKIAQEAFTEILESKYLTKTAESAPIFPEVKNMLQSFKNSGLKLGILSADSTKGVEGFVANHELQNYIDLSMGVEQTLFKPYPQLYINACNVLDIAPEKTLMVGDSQADIHMAKAAGAKGTIGINRYTNSLSLSADVQILNLSEMQIL